MKSISFEFETEKGTYRDALHFEDDCVPSDEEIEAMKQERLQNWLNWLASPPPAIEAKKPSLDDIPEGTPEEVIAAIKKIIEG